MAEEKASGKIAGWVKALFTSVLGIVSGAAIMYLTPLVNNVVKPAKPVANFSHQASGLTVTFNNRSTGGIQGWWDFGDGSALEPYEPGSDTIAHTYAKPSVYNVRLILQNLLGEENERSVAVTLDQPTRPTIDAFAVVPVTPLDRAPATLKIISQVKNAKVVALGVGDEPLKMETTLTPEKYVTLRDAGYCTLRLVAFNGDQVEEKSQQVIIGAQGGDKPTATLKVTYVGFQVEQKVLQHPVVFTWDAKHQGATCPVSKEVPVPSGWSIVAANYEPPAKGAMRNLKPEVSPDHTKVRISGELLKPSTLLTGKNMAAPQCAVRLELTLVRRSAAVTRTVDPVMMELNAPGSTALPLPPPPAGLEVQNKQVSLEIQDGRQVLWNQAGLPNGAAVTMRSRQVRVTALEQGNQLRLDVVEARSAVPVSRPGG